MKHLTCIVCPRGCELTIDEVGKITGNFCVRGAIYAKEELACPKRMLTTSVRVINRKDLLCSVKTSAPVKKEDIMKFVEFINRLKVTAPCPIGQVLARDVFDTGIDIVTTKDIK